MGLFDKFKKKKVETQNVTTKSDFVRDINPATYKYINNRITPIWGGNSEGIEAYTSNDAFFSVVNRLSEISSNLPLGIYDNFSDKKVIEGDVYNKIYKSINSKQGIRDFIFESFINWFSTGDLYIWKKTVSFGFPSEYIVLPSQNVRAWRLQGLSIFDPISYYDFYDGNRYLRIEVEEMIHVQDYNPDVTAQLQDLGLSPSKPLKNILTSSNELAISEASIFKNGGANKLISGASVEFGLLPADKEALEEGLRQRRGGAQGTNKALISDSPVTVHDIGMSPQELQMYNAYLMHLRRFCSAFGVQSQLFNDPMNKAYNNMDAAIKGVITDVAIPRMERFIESVFEKHVLPEYGVYMKIERDLIDVLQDSPTAQKDVAIREFEKGLILDTEYREKFGYSKLKKSEEAKQILASILGVGGTQALVAIVADPFLTSEQKLESLQILFGLTPEEAQRIVYGQK